ncbi:MAG: hypothetical protein HYU28_10960 [Actinobacteria bacterium]|nr:hypothetical protein [Actinomycetota bacterium]
MIDEHLHLVPHGGPGRFSIDDVRAYARAAAGKGVDVIAITEHLFRFPDVQDALGAWWSDDPDPRLRDQTAGYLAEERLSQTLAEYVDVVLEAASALEGEGEGEGEGAAVVRLGLEVDFYPGRMDEVASLLAPHPWDVLLGSVHWLGAWGLDQLDDEVVRDEWDRRDPDGVWLAYVEAIDELAGSGVCDVLAHVDLPKLGGVRPVTTGAEIAGRLVKAAAGNGLCVEVSSAGWRKPVGEAYPAPPLLADCFRSGVAITLASDAHTVDLVADRTSDLVAHAVAAGYREAMRFDARSPRPIPLRVEDFVSEHRERTGQWAPQAWGRPPKAAP